jgi:hypothetical protein
MLKYAHKCIYRSRGARRRQGGRKRLKDQETKSLKDEETNRVKGGKVRKWER